MAILRVLRRTLQQIRLNWKSLVMFEFAFKSLIAAGFALLINGCFNLLMRLQGRTYLTRESIFAFLLHPLTLVALLLLLLLSTLCAIVDLGAVIYILDCSAQGFRCHQRQVVHTALHNLKRVLKPENMPLMVLILLLMPFMGLSILFGLLVTISLPDIIRESIRLNPEVYGAILALVILSPLLLMRWLYTPHYFTLEGLSFREARQRSIRLSRNPIKSYAILLAAQAVFSVLMVLVLMTLTVLGTWTGRALYALFHRPWLVSGAVWYSVAISLGITFVFSIPISCGCLSQLFYGWKRKTGEELVPTYAPAEYLGPVREKMLRALRLALTVLTISSLILMGWLVNSGRLNPPIENLHVTEITAHRGASAYYPENTMAAFRGAWELGADWIELDVQQTRDGQLVILHDSNTRRTTGVRGAVWNMDYAQIAQLDAGSAFSREFAGERIPLLSEVAEFARDTGIRLNIELKPTGHEVDFEQGVIDVIRAYHLEDSCVITSQVYGVLERVKACDESITTVYVTSLAYGSIDYLTAADHFSVQSSSVTEKLVSRIHNQGRQIFAWTVNNKNSIERMIGRNVDNIITDDITLARSCVSESRYSQLLSDWMQTLESDSGE